MRDVVDHHRGDFLDAIRVFLGVALTLKGLSFELVGGRMVETLGGGNIPFATGLVAHYLVVAHLVGGLFLATGLVTRAAAIAQLPALLGAVLFVHGRSGLFAAAGSLELDLLVLFLLAVFSVAGAGRLSLDYLLRTPEERRHLAHGAV
jgi:uncharacterized membrane protein YphA (DoxX/SURF4 family)